MARTLPVESGDGAVESLGPRRAGGLLPGAKLALGREGRAEGRRNFHWPKALIYKLFAFSPLVQGGMYH